MIFRKRSITWPVRVEKYAIQTLEGASILFAVGVPAGLIEYVRLKPELLQSADAAPLIVGTVAGGFAMAATLVKVYFFPSNPQPIKAKARQYGLSTAALIPAAKELPQPVTRPTIPERLPWREWPVDLAHLKFYCSRIAFRGVSVSMNTWTWNSTKGDPDIKIFGRRVYQRITDMMKDRDYIRELGVGDRGKNAGMYLTNQGFDWCKEICNTPTPSGGGIEVLVKDQHSDIYKPYKVTKRTYLEGGNG